MLTWVRLASLESEGEIGRLPGVAARHYRVGALPLANILDPDGVVSMRYAQKTSALRQALNCFSMGVS